LLGVARIDTPGFRVKERTLGRKKKSSTTPPCEQAFKVIPNFKESVKRKFP